MLAQTDTQHSERRMRARARSLKQAKILFNNNKSIYDAVLKNVSAYGATINVAQPESLPDAFNLHIVHDNFTVPCQVKWRRPDSIGVIF